jgi:hypothetical protein
VQQGDKVRLVPHSVQGTPWQDSLQRDTTSQCPFTGHIGEIITEDAGSSFMVQVQFDDGTILTLEPGILEVIA